MLKCFRQRTAPVAAALLVALVTLWAPHSMEPGHDADYAVVVIPHDESAHQLGPEPSDSHTLHCVVCHLARVLRPRTATPTALAPVAHRGSRVHLERVQFSLAAQAAQPPLRSPPASPRSA